jgi:hypothetical protein
MRFGAIHREIGPHKEICRRPSFVDLSSLSEGLMQEPLQAPLLGTPRPGPPSRAHRSLLARLLEWTLVAITAANVVVLLLIEGMAEALESM